MNDNTKIEVAREIMNAKIAKACKNGYNPNDSEIKKLLNEEKEMNKFNFVIIDKILTKYGKEIKGSIN